MNMDKNRLEALRNRYPVGTMIQLDDMTDDPNPVEAGTLGTVRAVDALGTVHVEWDNGRTLGLVPGVDRFHPVQPELYTLRWRIQAVSCPGVRFLRMRTRSPAR